MEKGFPLGTSVTVHHFEMTLAATEPHKLTARASLISFASCQFQRLSRLKKGRRGCYFYNTQLYFVTSAFRMYHILQLN